METGNRDLLNRLSLTIQPGDNKPLPEKTPGTARRLPEESPSNLLSAIQNFVKPGGSFIPKEDPEGGLKPGIPPRTGHNPVHNVDGEKTVPRHTLSPADEMNDTAGTGTAKDGLYLYAITERCRDIPPGIIGIDGEMVYAIPHRNMAAIVHVCPLTPYASDDECVITEWVLAHQETLDRLLNAGITLIPFSFDTIIKPKGNQKSSDVLIEWLSKEHEKFQNTFDKIRGKKEYGIQVFCNTSKIRDALMESNEKIKAFSEEIRASGPGKEYLLRQKIGKEVKTATDSEIAGIVSEITGKIQQYCDEIKPGKTKKAPDPEQAMIMNCSCLVSDENYPKLGAVLEDIEKEGGPTIRFTGPWAVYSFV